jgi:hypothetical protein
VREEARYWAMGKKRPNGPKTKGGERGKASPFLFIFRTFPKKFSNGL